jgi:hypothetical protein
MKYLDLSTKKPPLSPKSFTTVENDRYPFSPRIRTLRGILTKLRPEPVREPPPPLKTYAPPSRGRWRRRG